MQTPMQAEQQQPLHVDPAPTNTTTDANAVGNEQMSDVPATDAPTAASDAAAVPPSDPLAAPTSSTSESPSAAAQPSSPESTATASVTPPQEQQQSESNMVDDVTAQPSNESTENVTAAPSATESAPVTASNAMPAAQSTSAESTSASAPSQASTAVMGGDGSAGAAEQGAAMTDIPSTTPTTAAAASDSTSTTIAAPSTTSPVSVPAPAPVASSPAAATAPSGPSHAVWLTPNMARSEGKKFRAGCGWQLVAVDFAQYQAAQRAVTECMMAAQGVQADSGRKPRKSVTLKKEEEERMNAAPAPVTPQPAAGRGMKGSKRKADASTPATPRTSARSAAATASTPSPVPPAIDATMSEKERQLAELQRQIDALKSQEAVLTGSSPSAVPPSSAASGSPHANKKRKTNPPTPVAIPSTPGMSRQSSTATVTASPRSTPSNTLLPPTPSGQSRAGRVVKTPAHYRDEIESSPSQTLSAPLRRASILLDHLRAHKSTQGVFNEPVNYTDPNQPYYAPNYLQIIGPTNAPMDLGTVRTKLHSFQYATLHDFVADVRMVYRNAMLYNPQDSWIHISAKKCSDILETEIQRIQNMPDKKESKAAKGKKKKSEVAYATALPAQPTPTATSKSSKKTAKRQQRLDEIRHDYSSMVSNPVMAAQTNLLEQMAQRIMALERKLQETAPAASAVTAIQQPSPTQPAPHHAAYSTPAKAAPYKPPSTPAARKKSATPASSAVHARNNIPLTQKEKQQLKEDIFRLPGGRLQPVVEIISKSMPKTAEAKDDADEIEIDIDKLEIATLRELQAYVKKALTAMKRQKPAGSASAKRATPGKAAAGARTPTPLAHPQASPPAAAATASPYPRTSPSTHTAMPSPGRLDQPPTPNMHRGTSQVGASTPAIKYDSESDSDTSSSSSDSDDDGDTFTSHLTSASTPSILDVNRSQTTHDVPLNAAAWSSVASTNSTPSSAPNSAAATAASSSSTSSGSSSALWSDFQRSQSEQQARAASLSAFGHARELALEREKHELLAANEARKAALAEAAARQQREEQQRIEARRAKLEADREAARRARQARESGMEASALDGTQAEVVAQMEEL